VSRTSDVVLATVNAKFQHAAFGLRYLLANLGPLQERAVLKEWSLGVRERDVVEQIIQLEPTIVGLSVYIWNVDCLTRVAQLLKTLRPDIILVIGGPEVSHEWEDTDIFELADYLVRGEGDRAFSELCRQILSGSRPLEKVVPGGLPDLSSLDWPYSLYDNFDLEHGRIIYVEASRGCPFQCHFCLSSLDRSVRAFDLDGFLDQMDILLSRGVRQFKFVDRTFNLKAATSERILSFFQQRYKEGMFLHFEMIPDRLPPALKPIIAGFPAGVLQFEVGIQSFDPEVCARIGRRQDFAAIDENLTFLRDQTGVHVHADLIAGLPGEDIQSFGRGFDQLYALGVAEIQVGILKRLRGTPITQAGKEWGMRYSPNAPYEVLRTSHLTFRELQKLQRFARFWDLVANSGRFPKLTERLLCGPSPFQGFMAFSEWLYDQLGATAGISAKRLGRLVATYLRDVRDCVDSEKYLEEDFSRTKPGGALPHRQARHLEASRK
jgi:radical SAM superfamily enzyme YgiQ (UPF0313 family)